MGLSYSLKISTKYTILTFFLKSEHTISGEFHVPEYTSSYVRPSDALKGTNNEIRGAGNFNGLCNATVRDQEGQEREAAFVQIARDAIAWVEFPPHFEWQGNKRSCLY